jgi:DNA-directed RNA polymerase subunit RPC12/RpoP
MVSVVENQTLSRRLQHYVEEEKENGENLDSHEPCQKILDQKSIAAVQICFRCGRKFPFKKGRKRCPYCQSILRTNIILKASQF